MKPLVVVFHQQGARVVHVACPSFDDAFHLAAITEQRVFSPRGHREPGTFLHKMRIQVFELGQNGCQQGSPIVVAVRDESQRCCAVCQLLREGAGVDIDAHPEHDMAADAVPDASPPEPVGS